MEVNTNVKYELRVSVISNGFLYHPDYQHSAEFYPTLDALFSRILLAVEGRCETFTGNKFGTVIIERGISPMNTES